MITREFLQHLSTRQEEKLFSLPRRDRKDIYLVATTRGLSAALNLLEAIPREERQHD